MKNAFILNPTANTHIIKDSLYEKTAQARAIASCILLVSDQLQGSALHDIIWAIDSYLEQIDQLQTQLENIA